MEKGYLGVDVGGTTVKFGLFTSGGEPLGKWTIESRRGYGLFDDIAGAIRKGEEEYGRPAAIGFGIPGPVCPDGTVEICPNLDIRDVNFVKEMKDRLPEIPMAAANDANAAALGEIWLGSGSGFKDAVMFTLGTGLGGGIVLDGRVLSGSHGLGGEIGHLHVRDDLTEPCGCGGYGCLEQCVSATGIVREARAQMAAGRERGEEPSAMEALGDELTAKDVSELAKKGDPAALRAMESAARYLGIAMATLAMTVDPEVFIIGGGVSAAGTWFTDKAERWYHHYSPLTRKKAEVRIASLGSDAGIVGAASLAVMAGRLWELAGKLPGEAEDKE